MRARSQANSTVPGGSERDGTKRQNQYFTVFALIAGVKLLPSSVYESFADYLIRT